MTLPEVIFTICRRTTASPYYILKSLFWYNYGKSHKTLKKYTDKICDQILKAKNAWSAEMFIEIQNTGWILFASAKMD